MVRNDIIPLINGVAHDWASISLMIAGAPVTGVTKIDYSDEVAMENNYGIGQKPVSRGYGQYSASCKITLLAETVAALEQMAPNGRLQNLGQFPIIVSYLPQGAAMASVHRILGCEFKSNSRSAAAGDTKIEIEYELIVTEIKWQ